MCSDEAKGIVRAALEMAYNQGHLKALDRIYAPCIRYHRPPLADMEGLEALKEFIADIRSAFSNVQLAIDEVTLEGEVLAGRWTFRGTHTGRSPSMPVPPTGRGVTVTGCCMAHWTGGRIDEEWVYSDWLGLFQQLGVVPPMG
jgi:predicted ester cyclase